MPNTPQSNIIDLVRARDARKSHYLRSRQDSGAELRVVEGAIADLEFTLRWMRTRANNIRIRIASASSNDQEPPPRAA